MPGARGAGGLAGVVTLLSSGGLWLGDQQDGPLPVVKINSDDSLLQHWPSESYGADLSAAPECRFWNFSVQYDSSLCNHFTISRSSSSPTRALERATRCAVVHGSECVLSPEVGLAIPAVFVNVHQDGHGGGLRMILGPRLVPLASEQQHVRAAPPDGDGVTDTRTFVFNRSVQVEYLDGESRVFQSRRLEGMDAYCVQLLRAAFEPRCWDNLD